MTGVQTCALPICIGILVASILDVTKDGLYGEIPEGTMDEGSYGLSRLSIEEIEARSHPRGSRGQPAAQKKKKWLQSEDPLERWLWPLERLH